MKAAILERKKKLSIEDVPSPLSPPAGFVKVKVESVGLCGSDVHYYNKGAIGSFVLKKPMILGHEVGGIITEVGKGVNLEINSTVALEPGVPCEECQYCMTGRYNLCKSIKFFATPPTDGAMTEYIIHPAKYTFVTDKLSSSEASLAEPLSVGIFALRSIPVYLYDKIAILGAGPVGILTAFVARLKGLNVAIYDIRKDRIDLAKEMNFSAYTLDKHSKNAYDIVVDCTGNIDAISWGQSVTRSGGTIVLVGMGENEANNIDGLDLVLRGIKVKGVFRYSNTFPTALKIIEENRDKLHRFTEQKIDMEDLPNYLEKGEQNNYIKTIITV